MFFNAFEWKEGEGEWIVKRKRRSENRFKITMSCVPINLWLCYNNRQFSFSKCARKKNKKKSNYFFLISLNLINGIKSEIHPASLINYSLLSLSLPAFPFLSLSLPEIHHFSFSIIHSVDLGEWRASKRERESINRFSCGQNVL